ncbi:MAG: histidinol dehydrogenase, partial [Gemmataceae bacterium]|nr:histidinol dehydrogenase [Gemmataceae bacterium]
GVVGIDCIAGPSEVVVLADPNAPPEFIAAELLAQAEHSPGSSVLVSWNAAQVDAVATHLESRLTKLDRADLTRDALERYGALVLARDEAEAVRITNQLAPEHLQIAADNPRALADRIDNAGAMFLGNHTPVALGDYAAGPSHVLPTGGSARWASGLTSNDFLKRSSIIHFEPAGLKEIASDVIALARAEGLTAHAESVQVRLDALDSKAGKGGR